MKVRYFSDFFTYSFKVLPGNARGLRKIGVRASVPDDSNLITVICLLRCAVDCASPDKSNIE